VRPQHFVCANQSRAPTLVGDPDSTLNSLAALRGSFALGTLDADAVAAAARRHAPGKSSYAHENVFTPRQLARLCRLAAAEYAWYAMFVPVPSFCE
jgi:hypothetical protein